MIPVTLYNKKPIYNKVYKQRNKVMTNQQVLDQYIAMQLKVLNQLDELKFKIEDEEQNVEEVNYGHVGDLNHISKVLENLIKPI